MQRQHALMGFPLFLFTIVFFLSSMNSLPAVSSGGIAQNPTGLSVGENNPFTAEASLIRYWNKKISNNLTKPDFLLSKASPLNAVQSSYLTKLAEARFFCELPRQSVPNVQRSLRPTGGTGGFKNGAGGGTDVFKNYNKGAGGTTGGAGGFKNYNEDANVPNLRFTSGKFFRESMLKQGTIMPMPDIKDKMPKRSSLPHSIASKLPFSSSRISELDQIFHAIENSTWRRSFRTQRRSARRDSHRARARPKPAPVRSRFWVRMSCFRLQKMWKGQRKT
ncbi:hypothetical protein NE237_006124 [Protea cynaroides]|uniref:BURP domain-containing protein n=1 Tax=Protea cynaroides TaxID=273540 RepID=A0A9Q0KM23_9MAGN|nr:hypothetical protein NE237_006124 [Protea cynaroides]